MIHRCSSCQHNTDTSRSPPTVGRMAPFASCSILRCRFESTTLSRASLYPIARPSCTFHEQFCCRSCAHRWVGFLLLLEYQGWFRRACLASLAQHRVDMCPQASSSFALPWYAVCFESYLISELILIWSVLSGLYLNNNNISTNQILK